MNQAEVLDFLADPATHGGAPVHRIETHISVLFLAGEKAWKLKKAVTLPFLDFASLEQRHAACLTEIEVNRVAAGELYLGVVPVTRDDAGSLHLGGDGAVVEWLVEMRRFQQENLLSALLDAGKVDRRLIQDVAEAAWKQHRQAPIRSDKGGAAGLRHVIRTNAATMAGLGAVIPPQRAEHVTQASLAMLERLAPLMDRRRAEGRVRRCHGDLHCGNICLYQGRALPFDAIEFSEDFACVDTFYDLCFLLMDLDHRGHRALASHAMNHYLDLSGDYEAVAMTPLMLSTRAIIRAHVLATMGQGKAANSYMDAAEAYLRPSAPRLVAVGGLSGSGKSHMGRELAPFMAAPGAAVVRTDALRKQIMGTPLLEKLPPQAYDGETGRRTYDRLYDTCLNLLRAGHAVVADAVFAKPEQRAAIEAVARQAGVPFDGLWLWTEPELAARRIEGRQGNVSDATVEVLRQQLQIDLGPMTWTKINTGGSKDAALASGRAALCL
ncbi:bifunctional aminoglycoside phosphotransferase/ATP-binding protein [Magnetospirillum sp. 64-120]|uniref:bifunctional aminoglycoside phosphotransferase/ATP-binding protein n=1 Tax=Magnetospirillum sp. 64-120 TaxID=1895778 RepID=UPI0009281342|nr:bifunctional aminoglycoside phosphotransferase/ATP-binding protein [Magnetospirillum sp. 64-120]OJX79277.1 MAG: hypothetical protein BGO92_12330 [Magnetospirillum sp. 64-120]